MAKKKPIADTPSSRPKALGSRRPKSSYQHATGGGRSKRELVELEDRRREASRLYLAGHSQAEIAGILGVGRSTVTIDLQLIRRDWRQSAIASFNEKIEKELENIDWLEFEARAAWERSQQPEEQVTETTVAGKAGRKCKAQTTKVTRGQCGSASYLSIIDSCIAQRRKILGLDAVVKTEQTITADVSLSTRFLGRAQMRREVELGLEKIRSTVHEAVAITNPN